MTPENEANLMRAVGAIEANIAIILANEKATQTRIIEVERKINKHTGILAVLGSSVLLFKDKLMEFIGVGV